MLVAFVATIAGRRSPIDLGRSMTYVLPRVLAQGLSSGRDRQQLQEGEDAEEMRADVAGDVHRRPLTSIAFLLAALTWIWIPETKGRKLA
jgi:hypothetical protein